MSKLNKKTVKHSLIAGGIFATGMALLDFLGQTAFNFWKYIFNFIFMGICLGVFVIKPSLKNHMHKSNIEDS